ncbi:LOW QUALITY PROTEIN: breast cancer type 2 susceptibility protein homolog [Rhagoletis pomonella]|uniref:LOW QUALITY PROTEIN: breast cancer type 2 susceptibility protein homolog n=1 Tax=Rhagoletis pomonella TaxID=28610 RepID=UPI001786FF0E|nr:LOW QUALITY PROTEIN: breast cancer type 2 susceptibility protein homolog [Rhagoletis pomonella]
MADESIKSSPQKLNRSIHRSRLHRKNKRLNATFTRPAEATCSDQKTASNIDETIHDDLSCTLLVMYDSEECEDDDTKAQCLQYPVEKPRFQIDANYDPFAEQRLLLLADRFRPLSRNSTSFVATQGFEPCNNLLFQPPKFAIENNTISKSNTKDVFEITDSELLQVCEETEKNTEKAKFKPERTGDIDVPVTPDSRQKPKSIVDLILEDFCSSPASPEPQQSSEESSFHFRFANEPLRTYSRRRQDHKFSRKNIAEQYVQSPDREKHCAMDDDLLSNDSDLSVQEDHTQLRLEAVSEEGVYLQNSQKLCENLQNLSAYFSELSGGVDRKPETCEEMKSLELVQNKDQNVVQSVADKSSGIYYTAIKENTNNFQKDESEEINKQCLTSHLGHISAEEDFKGFPSEDEETSDGMKPISAVNCDIVRSQVHEVDSLNEDDEWNDECDFFANFDMEEALDAVSKSKLYKGNSDELMYNLELNADSATCFRTASNKTVEISMEAKARANEILQELPPLPTNTSCTDDFTMNDEREEPQHSLNQTITISKHVVEKIVDKTSESSQDTSTENRTNPSTNLDGGLTIEKKEMPSLVGFCTASNKKITISSEAKQHAAKILEQLPPLQHERTSLTRAAIEKESFIGFTTASSKAIKISKEAQERALKILEHLPELNVIVETNNEAPTNAPNTSISCAGFRTASSKAIRISEEAQKRAAVIMQDVPYENVDHIPEECIGNMQFSEWPMEGEEAQTEVKASTTSNEGLPGFSTASKKPILVSELAKQKAAAILENLPKLSDALPSAASLKNSENATKAEPLENVVFSEWPLLDADDVSKVEQESQLNVSSKRKRDDIDLVPNGEELSSSPPTYTKLICKSVGLQRSPLAHIQQSVTRSSLSELAVKTPPDYAASRSIIARKNLLSLNKRKKSNAKIIQRPNELKDESVGVKTPTKIGNIAELKSPPKTPNLREFFASACVSTSTPHPPLQQETRMRTRASKRAELEAASLTTTTETTTPIKEASLKRIDWDNETLNKSASSLNASRLSNSSCSNVTKIESKPTPRQRIERLRMYGKPPSLSPIYMSSKNNCRISGLKRHSHSATKDEQ